MADGKTHQEAVGNADWIIEDSIEAAKEKGRPIP
jgi:predicted RNase H-like HicB family nuclease